MGEVSDCLTLLSRPINEIWDATIGSYIGYWADKHRFDRQKKFEDYKLKIMAECAKIPKDMAKEPKMSIVGPALDASRFYIDEEVLREMFAKLIANSMNIEKNKFVQSAFVEIIKQMSPLDATILKTFANNKQQPIAQVIDYRTEKNQKEHNTYIILLNLLYFMPDIICSTKPEIVANAVSINNLSRLGLIEYTISEGGVQFNDKELYANLDNFVEQNIKSEVHFASIIRGIVHTTDFGDNFIRACLL